MKYGLIASSLILSSAAAFTFPTAARQWNKPSSAIKRTVGLKISSYDQNGNNDRIEAAYEAWCKVYGKNDHTRFEIFAYHYLLAEKYFQESGIPVKLNEFADMTADEYRSVNGGPAASSEPYFTSPPESATNPVTSSGPPTGSGISNYLDSIPQNVAVGGPGMSSYLDSVQQNPAIGGPGMGSYLDSVGGGGASAATPFQPTAPAAPVAGFSSPPQAVAPVASAGPPGGAGIANYLDSVPQNPAVGGPGLTSYLDSVPQNPAVGGGTGMTSYLDSIAGAGWDGTVAAPAAPVATAASSSPPQAAAPVASAGPPSGAGIANYLDSVPQNPAVGGAGMASYLDSVPQNPAVGGGGGMTSYLDSVGSAPASPFTPAPVQAGNVPPTPQAPEAPAAPSYLDAVPAHTDGVSGSYLDALSGSNTAPTGSGPTSYLDGLTSFSDSYAPKPSGNSAGSTSYLDNLTGATPEAFEYPQAPPAAAPAYQAPPPQVVADEPLPVAQSSTVEHTVVEEPVYIAPASTPYDGKDSYSFGPSRNIPGSHWMDVVTPISSYHQNGLNSNWEEGVKYQPANTKYEHPEPQEANSFASSTQESFMPTERRRIEETFGGGFVIN